MRFWAVGILSLLSVNSFGASSYVYLFESAKARAISGLSRQKARGNLAAVDFDRAARLFEKEAISREEYEQFEAAVKVGRLDLKIAEIRARQASITLDLAQALARNGRRIPLCHRRKQSDENTVSKLLKRPKAQPAPAFPDQGSGTKISLQTEEPPSPPEVKPPEVTPDPPEPPTPTTPTTPETPDVDFPDVPVPVGPPPPPTKPPTKPPTSPPGPPPKP